LNVEEFLKTIYLGDRYCTKIVLDGSNNNVEIHVNQISRIRDDAGQWNLYYDEDIVNGVIVITNVEKIAFDESGLMPNDQLYDIYAEKLDNNSYEFVIEASNIDEDANSKDVMIKIIGGGIYISDPKRLNVRIVD